MAEEGAGISLRRTGEAPGTPDGIRMRTVYYDILADGVRVGVCELRPETTWTTRLSGQAAYTVYPPCRGHRYAAKALRLLCCEARALGLDGLTVTCRPENAASRRTLELAGAVLEAIEPVPAGHPLHRSGVREVCVYHIDIKEAVPCVS